MNRSTFDTNLVNCIFQDASDVSTEFFIFGKQK